MTGIYESSSGEEVGMSPRWITDSRWPVAFHSAVLDQWNKFGYDLSFSFSRE